MVLLCPGSLWGRVEEAFLWHSRQLGEHSPSVLLRSLVYLNTKYFGLRTVEQHMRLSFGNVYGPSTTKPHNHDTTVCICIPSISQDHHGTFPLSQLPPKITIPVHCLMTGIDHCLLCFCSLFFGVHLTFTSVWSFLNITVN